MIKSSTPVWVLLFSSLFGFERPNFRVVGVISVIVFGVLLTIDGEPQFNIHGFSLVLIAAVASGLRWNMTQLLMKDMKEEKINQSSKNERTEQSPLSTMYHLSPVMFSTMILLSFYLENPFQKQQQIMKAHTLIYEVVYVLLAMSVGGILGKINIQRKRVKPYSVYIIFMYSVHHDIVRTLFDQRNKHGDVKCSRHK